MTNQDLRVQLQENLDESEWEWLIPHAKRDAIIVVKKGLELIEVGAAVAADDTGKIKVWISKDLIAKPSTEEIDQWNRNRTKRFNTLIIQPYVLVKAK